MKGEFIKYHIRKASEGNKPLSFLQKRAIEEAVKIVNKDLEVEEMAMLDYGDISQAKITIINKDGKKEVKKVSELTEEENKAFCYQLGAINSHLPIVRNM